MQMSALIEHQDQVEDGEIEELGRGLHPPVPRRELNVDVVISMGGIMFTSDIPTEIKVRLSDEVNKAFVQTLVTVVREKNNHAFCKLLSHVKSPSLGIAMSDGYTLLHHVVESGTIEMLNATLEYAIDVNAQVSRTKTTVLYMACAKKQPAMVAKLLAHPDIRVSLRLANGETALHAACRIADAEIVDLLLSHHIDAEAMAEQGTALDYACMNGSEGIVAMLLEYLAPDKINQPNASGTTALHIAARHGYDKVIKMLMAVLTPPQIAARNQTGETAWSLAAQGHHINSCLLLSMCPAVDVNQKLGPDQETVIHRLITSRRHNALTRLLQITTVDVNIKNRWGLTPLVVALQCDDVETVRVLVNDARVNLILPVDVDLCPTHPLMFCGPASIREYLSAVKHNLSQTAWAEAFTKHNQNHNIMMALTEWVDFNANTPILVSPDHATWVLHHVAVLDDQPLLCRVLAYPDLNVNITDCDDNTAVHCVIERRCTLINARLITMMPDYDGSVRNRDGLNPIELYRLKIDASDASFLLPSVEEKEQFFATLKRDRARLLHLRETILAVMVSGLESAGSGSPLHHLHQSYMGHILADLILDSN